MREENFSVSQSFDIPVLDPRVGEEVNPSVPALPTTDCAKSAFSETTW